MLVFDPGRPDYLREAIIAIDREATASMREALSGRKPDRLKAAVDRVVTVTTAMLEKNVRMIRLGHLSAALVEREWERFFNSVARAAFVKADLSAMTRNGKPWTPKAFTDYARAQLKASPALDQYESVLPGAIRDAIAHRDAAAASTKKHIKARRMITGPYKDRAEWLKGVLGQLRLTEHGLEKRFPDAPNHETTKKILQGESVSESTLDKLALALTEAGVPINSRDIPSS